jgi:hypothetical protein
LRSALTRGKLASSEMLRISLDETGQARFARVPQLVLLKARGFARRRWGARRSRAADEMFIFGSAFAQGAAWPRRHSR